VLAQVVPVVERLSDRTCLRIQCRSEICGAGQRFKDDRIVRGRRNIFTPSEWSVVRDQNSRQCRWIAIAEGAQYGSSRVLLIFPYNLVIGERIGDRNRAMEIIRMRGAETWNLTPSLRPGRRVLGVSVDDATDFAERFVENKVSGKIGRRA
jgi:hypothetical protein